jgi:FkbM family methyltransferase
VLGKIIFDRAPVRIKECKHGLMSYLTSDSYVGQSLDLYGEWSEGEMDLLGQVVRPGMVVLDVGANIGVHTVFLAKVTGPAGRVYSFEPQPTLFHVLCANLVLNQLTNVFAIHAALGAVPGTVNVPNIGYTSRGNFGGIALDNRADGEPMTATTLDALNLTQCDLIKIDVEGMECDVLRGGTMTLSRLKPILYVENDRAAKSAELIRRLFEFRYRLYWHRPKLFNPNNHFGETRNVFANIISINMLCIPASRSMHLSGFREITSPDDKWNV